MNPAALHGRLSACRFEAAGCGVEFGLVGFGGAAYDGWSMQGCGGQWRAWSSRNNSSDIHWQHPLTQSRCGSTGGKMYDVQCCQH